MGLFFPATGLTQKAVPSGQSPGSPGSGSTTRNDSPAFSAGGDLCWETLSAWGPEHRELLTLAQSTGIGIVTKRWAWDLWLKVLVGPNARHQLPSGRTQGWVARLVRATLKKHGFTRLLQLGCDHEYVQNAGEKLFRLAVSGYFNQAEDQGKLAATVVLNHLWDQVARDLRRVDLWRAIENSSSAFEQSGCLRDHSTESQLPGSPDYAEAHARLERAGLDFLEQDASALVKLAMSLCLYPDHYHRDFLESAANESKSAQAGGSQTGTIRPLTTLEPAVEDLLEALAREPSSWVSPESCRWYRDELARLLFTVLSVEGWEALRQEESARKRAGRSDWKGFRTRKKNQLDNLVRRARRAREALSGLCL